MRRPLAAAFAVAALAALIGCGGGNSKPVEAAEVAEVVVAETTSTTTAAPAATTATTTEPTTTTTTTAPTTTASPPPPPKVVRDAFCSDFSDGMAQSLLDPMMETDSTEVISVGVMSDGRVLLVNLAEGETPGEMPSVAGFVVWPAGVEPLSKSAMDAMWGDHYPWERATLEARWSYGGDPHVMCFEEQTMGGM